MSRIREERPHLRYEWEGKVQEDGEAMLVIKTRSSRVDELAAYVRANHPYDVPEVISMAVSLARPRQCVDRNAFCRLRTATRRTCNGWVVRWARRTSSDRARHVIINYGPLPVQRIPAFIVSRCIMQAAPRQQSLGVTRGRSIQSP